MPRTKEQFEVMREKSRQLIIETALRLFSSDGYHAVPISRIAKEAGIATGLLYNYFKSKEHLLEEIVHYSLKDFISLIRQKAGDNVRSSDLTGLLDVSFSALKEKVDNWRLILRVLLQPGVKEHGEKSINILEEHIVTLSMEFFKGKGVVDYEKKARVLSVMIHGAFLAYIITGDEEGFEMVRNEIKERYMK